MGCHLRKYFIESVSSASRNRKLAVFIVVSAFQGPRRTCVETSMRAFHINYKCPLEGPGDVVQANKWGQKRSVKAPTIKPDLNCQRVFLGIRSIIQP